MENKNTVLALSLCVITLASLNMIQLTSTGRVLGDTTTTPIPMPKPSSMPFPTVAPPAPFDNTVPCLAVSKLVQEYCQGSITTPTPLPTSQACKTGLNKITYGSSCTTTDRLSGYYTARYICHDGYVGLIGQEASKEKNVTSICRTSEQLSGIAKTLCDKRGCTPSTITGKPENTRVR